MVINNVIMKKLEALMWDKYWRMLLVFLLVFIIPGTVAASEIVILVDGEAVQFDPPANG